MASNNNVPAREAFNNCLEAALRYAARGWSVIPVGHDKKPLIKWTEFQKRIASEEEIRAWWQSFPDANVAIVTGSVSGLLVVDVDLDKGASPEYVDALNLPKTATVKSPHGRHIYLGYRGNDIKNSASHLAPQIDTRCEAGYVLASPSVNAEGLRYCWEDCEADFGIADAPAALIGLLHNRKSPQPNPSTTVGLSKRTYSEGERNDAAAREIGRILQPIPVTEWEGCWQAIIDWNSVSCLPPLDEAELRQTFNSIVEKEQMKRSERLQHETVGLRSITLSELLSKDIPRQDWLVDRIFAKGTINIVSAAPNNYKTWVLLGLSLSIVRGEPAFGHFPTAKTGVLVVNEDDSERLLKDRLLKLGRDATLPMHFLVNTGFRLSESKVTELIEEMRRLQLEVVVFDTFSSIHDLDENKANDMNVVFSQLKRLTREGFTVILSHHHKKQSALGKDVPQEMLRGSTLISGVLGGHLTCEGTSYEGDNYIRIGQLKLKEGEKMEPFFLRVERETEDELIRFDYVEGFDPTKLARAKVREEIVNLLDKDPKEGLTVKELEIYVNKRVKCKIGLIRKAIKELESDGVLTSRENKDLGKAGRHNEKVYFLDMGKATP